MIACQAGKPCPTCTPVLVCPSITPTPHSGCSYSRGFCPMINCPAGKACPTCAPVLICSTPVSPGRPEAVGVGSVGLVRAGTVSKGLSEKEINDMQDAQNSDVCRRAPVKVINCPVGEDGNYACVVQGVQFTVGWIRVIPPSFYRTTSQNPVEVKGNTANVDFGISPLIY